LVLAGQAARLKAAATKARYRTKDLSYIKDTVKIGQWGGPEMNALLRYGSAMRSLSVGVALLALAAFAPGAARAQQTTTTKVTFTVTDPTGAAIPNARILMVWGTTFGLMATDKNGQLSVDMKGGRYNLAVGAPAYIIDHVYVDLTSAAGPASATKNVTVVLDPDDRYSQTVPKSKDSLLVHGYNCGKWGGC
jgi:hypothetical protein